MPQPGVFLRVEIADCNRIVPTLTKASITLAVAQSFKTGKSRTWCRQYIY